MPEPTIDEMLASLKHTNNHWGIGHYNAIRAILEQHRDHRGHDPERCEVKWREREAVRAFVERVEKKWGTSRYTGMLVELEELEKENNAETQTPN